MLVRFLLASLACCLAAPLAHAEEPAPDEGPSLRFERGPGTGTLGDVATVKIPEKFAFVDKSQMPLFNKLTGNLDNPQDIGALVSPDRWMIFFSWDPIGFVKDDEKDQLDEKELLKSFKDHESDANERRRKEGFEPMYIVGWETAPFYDATTHNLTWALRFRSGEQTGDAARYAINHEVRLLGRYGAMSAILVAPPDGLQAAVKELGPILSGFSFKAGSRYAEYRQGDKIAEYGLTGLVLGGGVLVAAKTGLLAQLGKFIKLIVVGGIAAVAGIYKAIKARFGWRER